MKPLKAKVSITLDTDVIDQLKRLSEEDDRSFSQYINLILKDYLARRTDAPPAGIIGYLRTKKRAPGAGPIASFRRAGTLFILWISPAFVWSGNLIVFSLQLEVFHKVFQHLGLTGKFLAGSGAFPSEVALFVCTTLEICSRPCVTCAMEEDCSSEAREILSATSTTCFALWTTSASVFAVLAARPFPFSTAWTADSISSRRASAGLRRFSRLDCAPLGDSCKAPCRPHLRGPGPQPPAFRARRFV